MHESWSRMLPELLRFSSRSNLLHSMPEHLNNAHFTGDGFNNALSMAADKHQNMSHKMMNMNNMSELIEGEDFGDEDLAMLGL